MGEWVEIWNEASIFFRRNVLILQDELLLKPLLLATTYLFESDFLNTG